MQQEKLDTLLSRCQIPIIDLAYVETDGCPDKSVVNRVAVQLKKALSEKGLALLVNHGIAEDRFKTAWSYLHDFCKLPTDVKDLYIRKDTNHGYVKPGMERFDGKTPELRHAFNICTLNKSNFPEPLPGFRPHISELVQDYRNLSQFLLQALAVGLGLPLNFFIDNHEHMLCGPNDNETTLRLLYYPPLVEEDNKCELIKGSYQRRPMDRPDFGLEDDDNSATEVIDSEGNASVITRCGAHCDYGTFTLLAQDSEGGLEVQLPGTEKFQRVGHLPGAILINGGEILSMWTSGKYPALPHRVIIPEQAQSRSSGRHSIAFFCTPDNAIEISPVDLSCETHNDKHSFETAENKVYATAYQHIQRRLKETYA